jgi:Ala-tRNA(Pro) deacylase
VYTCEAASSIELPANTAALKNILLRDQKRVHFYLLLLEASERVDFKLLKEITGQRLSFASSEELDAVLHVAPGSVSPLCLLQDVDATVRLLISETLCDISSWSMHPGVCTETVVLDHSALAPIIPHFRDSVAIPVQG